MQVSNKRKVEGVLITWVTEYSFAIFILEPCGVRLPARFSLQFCLTDSLGFSWPCRDIFRCVCAPTNPGHTEVG